MKTKCFVTNFFGKILCIASKLLSREHKTGQCTSYSKLIKLIKIKSAIVWTFVTRSDNAKVKGSFVIRHQSASMKRLDCICYAKP